MIRPLVPQADISPLLTLWLESTTLAHPFIPASYWHESLPAVRDDYLPHARSWVWDDDALRGFVSVMNERFVGALFVAPECARQGIGGALLRHAQSRYPRLSLEVYQQNTRAVAFYQAQGFRVVESAWQRDTRHHTWIMQWQADQTP
jgi:putative acetyltransferase